MFETTLNALVAFPRGGWNSVLDAFDLLSSAIGVVVQAVSLVA